MASKYVVVRFGDLNRGEHMNVAVLAWEHDVGSDTPVYQRMISDWTRIQQAFPKSGADGWVQEEVIRRISSIRTLGDYERTKSEVGPYTPFEFTEERPSMASAVDTLEAMWKFFLNIGP
jgi:hypothetical protein